LALAPPPAAPAPPEDPATTSVSVRSPAAAPLLRQRGAARVAHSDATAHWENVVAVLMETRPALGSVLLHATPAKIGGDELVIAFPAGSFYRRQADAPDAKSAIAEIAERVLGVRPTVSIVERDDDTPAGPTIAELETERQRARWEATRKKALNHPMVVEALSIFEARAELAEVRLDGD
nr:hypothetical protein [Myxococcota bacterium]